MQKQKLIFLRGLPASGKTSYAKKYQEKHPDTKRVNKDDLRNMLDCGKWSKNNENFIRNIDSALVESALRKGFSVIWDNTHLLPRDLENAENISLRENVEFELVTFDTPASECIKRDAEREEPVGAKVIQGLYERTKVAPKPYPINKDLPWVVICDIDGTLAIKGDRDQYDETRVMEDSVNQPIAQLLHSLWSRNVKAFFMSGRKDSCMELTTAWISKTFQTLDFHIAMRDSDDNRPDEVVKEELFNIHVRDKYNVAYVIDDRRKVCRMWYRLGLPLLMVGDPDSDF